jgi:CRP-like cAMP-binding protein
VERIEGVAHMAVVKLRTRRDRREQASLEQLRDVLRDWTPSPLLDRLVGTVERELSSRRGWRFIMVEPNLNSEVLDWLTYHSQRPLVAVRLWGKLFQYLPPDSNDVQATREELARAVGCTPAHVSTIMGELESIGARRARASATLCTRRSARI